MSEQTPQTPPSAGELFLAALRERDALRARYTALIGVVQQWQPGGSPPPGDAEMLAAWICRTLAGRADKAEAALRERSGSAHWDAIEDRLKRAEAALRRYVERDHSEALVLDAQRERDYQTHGPWCRCVDCVRLWPTAYKLPVRVALRAVPERRP